MGKPVFGICDQVRLKPACSATETSQGFEILDIASIDIILPKQRTTKLICAFVVHIWQNRFSQDVAQLKSVELAWNSKFGIRFIPCKEG